MKGRLSTILGVAIGAVFGAYVILFAIYNRVVVPVDFIAGRPKLPLYAVAAVFLVVGAAAMSVVTGMVAMRARTRRRRLERKITAQNEELKRLRNAPLTDPVGTKTEAGAEAETR